MVTTLACFELNPESLDRVRSNEAGLTTLQIESVGDAEGALLGEALQANATLTRLVVGSLSEAAGAALGEALRVRAPRAKREPSMQGGARERARAREEKQVRCHRNAERFVQEER